MSNNLFSLSQIIDIAFQAGEEILEIYDDKRLFSSSRLKKEKSPYTIAKLKAENFIIKRLQELGNEIPIISEKHNKVSYYYRKNWEQFWLVDALNGVKEYLKQTNEFTINIGLINNGVPVLGVVYAPALNLIYAADGEEGAIRIHKHKKVKIKTNKNSLYLIAAKGLIESPFDQEESKELEKYPIMKIVNTGSTLKVCKIADGSADVYFRYAPSMEWETAAAEAILTHAGGTIKHLKSVGFRYNKQMLKNKSFICLGDAKIFDSTKEIERVISK